MKTTHDVVAGAVGFGAEGSRNALQPGTWTAPDAGACVRRPCVELAGSPAEPEECR